MLHILLLDFMLLVLVYVSSIMRELFWNLDSASSYVNCKLNSKLSKPSSKLLAGGHQDQTKDRTLWLLLHRVGRSVLRWFPRLQCPIERGWGVGRQQWLVRVRIPPVSRWLPPCRDEAIWLGRKRSRNHRMEHILPHQWTFFFFNIPESGANHLKNQKEGISLKMKHTFSKAKKFIYFF